MLVAMPCRELENMLAFYLLLMGAIAQGSKDVCQNGEHMTVPNIGFRFVNFRLDSTDNLFHDYQLTEGWYYVGNETMPEDPPDDIFTCGTKFPVWLDGKHPTDDRIVTLSTCQLTILEDCSARNTIRIKKCKGFYVYYLRPTGSSNVGYCFGQGKNGTAPKYVSPKPVVRADVLVEKGKGDRVVSSTYFACDFIESKAENLFYVVSWYMNGNMLYMTSYRRSASDPLLRLTEKKFKSRGFKLGNSVSCRVRAFFDKDSIPGKLSEMADGYFAGIQVLTQALSFNRNETDASKRTIHLKPTIPIGCQGAKCNVKLIAYVPDHYGQCTGLAFDQSSCGTRLQSEYFNVTRNIIITTQDPGQYAKSDVYEIFLKTENTIENMIWSDYALPPIKVSINDPSAIRTYEGKRCYSKNDPHMRTFDGRVYDNHQDGDYILYKNTKYNTEVQARYYNCGSRGNNRPVKCNCGIAVRAGRDMFEINVCGGKTFIGYHYCDDDSLKVKSRGHLKYTIFFAYGTYVEVTLSNSVTFNTDIIPSSHDHGVTVGLCGRLDGDVSNDFHHRPAPDGHIQTINKYHINTRLTNGLHEYNNQPKEFIEQWRVTSYSENLFSPNFDKNQYTPWTFKTCVCTNATVAGLAGSSKVEEAIPCRPNGVALCTKGRAVGSHSCSFEHSRRRRSLKNSPVLPTVYMYGQRIHKRDIEITTMTEAEARQYCQDHIGASKVFALCSEVPNVQPESSIGMCVGDILLTGTTVWTDATKESMQDSCLTELWRNTTLREKQENNMSLAEQIEEIACPNNCSVSGICFQGECECASGYGGSDCSVDLSRGPTIAGLLDHGMCDEKEAECDHAYVFGSMFTDSKNLTCKLEEFTLSETGDRQELQVHFILAEFETLVEVMCPLSQTREKRAVVDNDDFVLGYTISVSNDGNNYEDGKDLFIYDSTCQLVLNTNNSLHFVLKDGFCYIDSRCVQRGDLNPNNKCFKCNDALSTKSWTKVQEPGCSETQNQPLQDEKPIKTDSLGGSSYLWVIGIVAGALVGLAVGVIVVIKLTKKRGTKVSDSVIQVQPITNSKPS